jgi:hypothetical protein
MPCSVGKAKGFGSWLVAVDAPHVPYTPTLEDLWPPFHSNDFAKIYALHQAQKNLPWQPWLR